MNDQPENQTLMDRAARFREFLAWAKRNGLSQSEVADRLGVPRQYVSNVKTGDRVLTELFARRVAEEFDVDHRWLLDGVGVMQKPSVASPPATPSEAETLLLPLLTELFAGEPRRSPNWDGALVAITGPAVFSARDSAHAYAYRLEEDDSTGRLKNGDIVLICQDTPDESQSGLFLVESGQRPSLAWKTEEGRWKSARTGRAIPAKSRVIGQCLGMIWAHF